MKKPGFALVTCAALVLLVAIVGSTIVDEGPASALAEPAENGLIAYSYAGDIYVGDPATGATRPLATHPAYEVNPVFSLDGERIAFIRGDPASPEATVVVVRADGSDERLVIPKGREHRGLTELAWTPDGASLVIQLDSPPFQFPYGDGELSAFDSFGEGTELVLTPPLARSIGGHFFSTNDEVAPMFRPPAGDRILSGDENELKVFERDLSTSTRLGSGVLEPFEPISWHWLAWSPDGTRIAFDLELTEAGSESATIERGLFVMSAAGDELRRVGGDAGFWQWSPDGSRIAFEQVRAETDRAVLVVVDLESGKERSLESTSAAGKDAGARFSTITNNNVVHHWYYEGWRWAPDGRSLLVLEDHRTHPWVIDIETGRLTELPWEADSTPSWQRLTSP